MSAACESNRTVYQQPNLFSNSNIISFRIANSISNLAEKIPVISQAFIQQYDGGRNEIDSYWNMRGKKLFSHNLLTWQTTCKLTKINLDKSNKENNSDHNNSFIIHISKNDKVLM